MDKPPSLEVGPSNLGESWDGGQGILEEVVG